MADTDNDFTGMTLGQAMRLSRRNAGFDVEYTAMTWGVSEATIYNWESDRSVPPRPAVTDWARRFECPSLVALYPIDGKRLVKGAGTLGYTLRKARVARNMRQQDLAKAMKVTDATISNWESGRSRPTPDALKALNDLLDADLTYEDGASTYKGFSEIMEEKAAQGEVLTRREEVLMVWWDMISRCHLDVLEGKLQGVAGYLNDDLAENIARKRGIEGKW